MIISEIQSEIGHCSCDSAKFNAPADFSHHAILCMTLSLTTTTVCFMVALVRNDGKLCKSTVRRCDRRGSQCKTQWMIDTVSQIVIFEAVFISM